MQLPPCTTDPEPFTSEVTLDVTSIAQRVALSASILPMVRDSSLSDPDITVAVVTTIAIWEELTGLSGEKALDLAVRIAADPQPVLAAVVPF